MIPTKSDRALAFDLVWHCAPNPAELHWIETGEGGAVGPRLRRAALLIAEAREKWTAEGRAQVSQ